MHCQLFCNSYCKTTGQPFNFNMLPNCLQYTTVFISLLLRAPLLKILKLYLWCSSVFFSMEIINRGRAYSCKFCFYKGELRKVKEHVQLTHVSEDRHQYFCQLCKFIGKSERELDRHIVHYAKHKQCREKLEMSSAFTAEEDYRVVRKDPASYWQFDCKRDCTKLSMLDSQQLWGSRMRPKSNFTEITTEVCPVRRQTLHLCMSSRRLRLMFRRWDL